MSTQKQLKREYTITETMHNGYNSITGDYEQVEAWRAPCGFTMSKKIVSRGEIDQNGDWKEYDTPRITQRTKQDVINMHIEATHGSYPYPKPCICCMIVQGYSKAKVLTQDQIARLFSLGIDGKQSSTENLRSVKQEHEYYTVSILWHYRTIEAIRLQDGSIIDNTECFSRGFATCPSVPNVKARLPLSTVENLNITILDKNDKGEVLFSSPSEANMDSPKAYFLYGSDERPFLVELAKPCNTIKEAYESMTPEKVDHARTLGVDVKRQGDLFFIPLSARFQKLANTQAQDVKKRTKTPCKRAYYQCQKCGIKTKSFITEDDRLRHSDRINYARSHPYVRWNSSKNISKKQRECKATDAVMKLIEYDSFKYSEFPEITILQDNGIDKTQTRHTATITALTLGTCTIVKGCVRHPEHSTLKLGETWHSVIQNTVKQSISLSRRGGFD